MWFSNAHSRAKADSMDVSCPCGFGRFINQRSSSGRHPNQKFAAIPALGLGGPCGARPSFHVGGRDGAGRPFRRARERNAHPRECLQLSEMAKRASLISAWGAVPVHSDRSRVDAAFSGSGRAACNIGKVIVAVPEAVRAGRTREPLATSPRAQFFSAKQARRIGYP